MVEILINEILSDTSRKMNEKFIKTTILYPLIMEYKARYNFESYSFAEIFYHYINKIEPIKCLKDDCNNKPVYESINRGYRKYCSNKCKSNDTKWREKVKETNLKKFGVENPFQSDEIKEKIKSTLIEKIGVDNPSKNSEIVSKANHTKKKAFIEKYKDYSVIGYDVETIKLHCSKCNSNFEIYNKTFFSRRFLGYDLCTICNPINSKTSNRENIVTDFIKNNYDGQVIISDKKVLDGKELDVYLPEINLAFEFNGLIWHSEFKVPKNYHLNKTENCLKNGIKLIHIWDDDWQYKQNIVKSRILNLLGKSHKIYARKCLINKLTYKDAKLFLDDNHIQGSINSGFYYGLFFNNELVSIMTFGKPRKNLNQINRESVFELTRFCNKLNTTVIGGASKLFNHFIKEQNPLEVISYADRSWSNGELYDKLGFEFKHNTLPNYYYIVSNRKENRFKYRKDILIKEGFDKNKSEHEIMLERKIYRIYDSGSKKYIWKK